MANSPAQVSWLTEDDYLLAIELEAGRWEVYSPLGVSLHAMRELGHWRPFSPGFIERRANAYARYIRPYVAGQPQRPTVAELRRQGGHPVAVRIAQLAEEILNHSDDHDVRGWADEILTLTGGNDAPRN